MTDPTPQPAPFKIGQRLRRIRPDGTKSGRTIDGVTHWFDRDGALATVIDVNNEYTSVEENEEGDIWADHGYNTVHFDEDINGVFHRCLDVEDLERWELVT